MPTTTTTPTPPLAEDLKASITANDYHALRTQGDALMTCPAIFGPSEA